MNDTYKMTVDLNVLDHLGINHQSRFTTWAETISWVR